jgi:hypothetical protein
MKRTLLVLALCVTFASAAFAQTGSDATAVPEITIGTVVPSGQDFVIVLDERNIDRAYPEWSRPLPGAWTAVVTREQFRSVVRDVVGRKLAAQFPNGLPPDAASGMKVEIKVKLGKSPEIGITIGC